MDEADVKSEQFGQGRGAQALPKQFVVDFFWKEENGGLASLCLIEHEVAFMRCRGAKVSDAQDLHLGTTAEQQEETKQKTKHSSFTVCSGSVEVPAGKA